MKKQKKDKLHYLMNKIKIIVNNHKYLSIFLFGLLHIICSEPFGFFYFLFISFSFLIHLLKDELNFHKRIKILFIFLTGYFLSQFNFLIYPLFVDIKSFWWIMPAAIFIAPAILSLIFIFFFLPLLYFIKKINNKLLLIFFFSISWSVAEYFRGNYLFNGFPWQIIGHLFNNIFLMQNISYLNIYQYSFFSLLFLFIPYLLYQKQNKQAILLLLMFLIFLLFGIKKIHFNKENNFLKNNKIKMIGSQPNFTAKESFSLNPSFILKKNIDLIAWARFLNEETILLSSEGIFRFDINDNLLLKNISQIIPNEKSVYIFGGNDFIKNKAFNSIFMIDHQGEVLNKYHKKHLVPFGEYLPMRKYLPKFIKVVAGFVDFEEEKQNNQEAFLYRNLPIIFPAICYDIIFHSDIKKQVENFNYKNKDKLIVNLSNDTWLGNGIGAYQHFNMARFSAIHAKVNILRIVNNGISAIINKNGKVFYKTKLNTVDVFKNY